MLFLSSLRRLLQDTYIIIIIILNDVDNFEIEHEHKTCLFDGRRTRSPIKTNKCGKFHFGAYAATDDLVAYPFNFLTGLFSI